MPHFEMVRSAHDGNESVSPGRAVTANDEGTLRVRRIRVKNRRKRYLDIHPEYFEASNLELADPLLYDRLVRRFQSPEERERDGRDKGYSGILEANLVRSEAKLSAIEHPDPNSPMVFVRASDGSIIAVEQDDDERFQSRDDGWERWKDVMAQRFLRGDDLDFEYYEVDESEDYDDRDEEERSKQDVYFAAENEEYVGEGKPEGQTGVQDF